MMFSSSNQLASRALPDCWVNVESPFTTYIALGISARVGRLDTRVIGRLCGYFAVHWVNNPEEYLQGALN